MWERKFNFEVIKNEKGTTVSLISEGWLMSEKDELTDLLKEAIKRFSKRNDKIFKIFL